MEGPRRQGQKLDRLLTTCKQQADKKSIGVPLYYYLRSLRSLLLKRLNSNFPDRYVADAQHVAIAVVNGVDYLCSWNFTHLVKVSTRREVNLVNSLMGYGQVEIIAPPEL